MRGLIAALFLMGATVSAQDITALVTWVDNATNETGFRLERNEFKLDFVPVVLDIPPDSTSAVDPGPLRNSTDYCYRVVAFNIWGESASSDVCATTPELIPNAPTGLILSIELPPGIEGTGKPSANPQPAELPDPPEATTPGEPAPPP